MVFGHPGDKVIQQVLTRHQQTGETDESHVQPLEPAEASRLTTATGLNVTNKRGYTSARMLSIIFSCRNVTHLLQEIGEAHLLDLLGFPFN